MITAPSNVPLTEYVTFSLFGALISSDVIKPTPVKIVSPTTSVVKVISISVPFANFVKSVAAALLSSA